MTSSCHVMGHRLVAIVITMYLLRIPIQQHRTELKAHRNSPAGRFQFELWHWKNAAEGPMTYIRAHLGGSDRSENQMLHTVKYFKSRFGRLNSTLILCSLVVNCLKIHFKWWYVQCCWHHLNNLQHREPFKKNVEFSTLGGEPKILA